MGDSAAPGPLRAREDMTRDSNTDRSLQQILSPAAHPERDAEASTPGSGGSEDAGAEGAGGPPSRFTAHSSHMYHRAREGSMWGAVSPPGPSSARPASSAPGKMPRPRPRVALRSSHPQQVFFPE